MKQAILENGNYVEALLDTAEAVYTVDFTHDRLEKIFYHSESAREFDLKIVLPCSYDTYCLKQREFITKDTRENYRIVEASAKLLGRFVVEKTGNCRISEKRAKRQINLAAKNCANVPGYYL